MSHGTLGLLERLFLLRVLSIKTIYLPMAHSAVHEAVSGG